MIYIYIYHGTPHCPGVFRYLDTSHDGDISAREFETLERVWRELQQSMFEPLGPGGWVIHIWANYNDLTATSLELWLIREMIPKWPYFRLVKYYNLPRYMDVYMIYDIGIYDI